MQDLFPNVLIPSSAAVGVLFAVFLWQRVSKISMSGGSTFRSQNGREYLLVRVRWWGRGEREGEGERRERGKPRKVSRARASSPRSPVDHHRSPPPPPRQEEEQRGDDEVR